MFLQVIWISNISNSSGKEILKEAWDGGNPMKSSFHWPPTVVACSNWSQWQNTLQKCLGLDWWRCLSQSLRKWLLSIDGCSMSQLLIEFGNTIWMDGYISLIFLLICELISLWQRAGLLEVKALWQDLHQAVIICRGQWLVLSGYANILDHQDKYEGIDKLIHSALAEDWHLKLQFSGSLNELCNNIIENQGFAVSNESFWDGWGWQHGSSREDHCKTKLPEPSLLQAAQKIIVHSRANLQVYMAYC